MELILELANVPPTVLKDKKIESRDLDYHGNEIEKHELGNFFEKPHLNKQIKIQVHLEWCTHFKSWEIHCKQESALRITKSVWFESSIDRNRSSQSFFSHLLIEHELKNKFKKVVINSHFCNSIIFSKWKWIESNALVKYFQSYFKIVFMQALLMKEWSNPP